VRLLHQGWIMTAAAFLESSRGADAEIAKLLRSNAAARPCRSCADQARPNADGLGVTMKRLICHLSRRIPESFRRLVVPRAGAS